MTALDLAYETASKNSAKQSEYYNLFLNSEIFIPTHDVPSENRGRRAGDNETINPVVISSEGKSYLMLFDSKERLSAWANRHVGFVALPGHVVVEIMSSDIHWILNAGTNHAKIFVPDEIKWLKETIARTKQEKLPRDTRVFFGAPTKVPCRARGITHKKPRTERGGNGGIFRPSSVQERRRGTTPCPGPPNPSGSSIND